MASPAMPLAGHQFEDPGPDPDQRPAPGQPAPKPVAPAKDERFEALQRENDELRGSNRQLMDLVGRPAAPAPVDPKAPRRQAAEEDDDIDWGDEDDAADPNAPANLEDEDPAVLVDEISKHGVQALRKRGLMTRAEVVDLVRKESRKASVTAANQVVQRTRAEVTVESRIIGEFPDLKDQTSELYKATVKHVQAAAQLNPRAGKDPTTLYLAARAASAEIKAKGNGRRENDDEPQPRSRGGRREVDDDDDRSDRDIHIASQQGDRGRSRSRIESDGPDDFVMSDDARAVAKAMGLTDDDYKKEATRVRGANGRNRR